MSETISGSVAVRAYNCQETFMLANRKKVEFNTTEIFALKYGQAYFGLRLDWTGALLVSVTILAIVLTRILDPENIDVGYAGLAMTYTATISVMLSTLNTTAVDMETRVSDTLEEFAENFFR